MEDLKEEGILGRAGTGKCKKALQGSKNAVLGGAAATGSQFHGFDQAAMGGVERLPGERILAIPILVDGRL